MSGERTTALAVLLGPRSLRREVMLVLLPLGADHCLFQLFQSQSELVRINPLRALAEPHALQLTDEVAQTVILFDDPLFLGPFRGKLAADAGQLGTLGRQYRLLRHKRGVQRVEIGEGRNRHSHRPQYTANLRLCRHICRERHDPGLLLCQPRPNYWGGGEARPVQPFQQDRKLGRRQANHPVADRGPLEGTALQAFPY